MTLASSLNLLPSPRIPRVWQVGLALVLTLGLAGCETVGGVSGPTDPVEREDAQVASTDIASLTAVVQKNPNDAEAWKAKTTTVVRMFQNKYRTDDAGTLAKKISSSDRQTLCSSISSARQHGVQDMGIDLVQASICK